MIDSSADSSLVHQIKNIFALLVTGLGQMKCCLVLVLCLSLLHAPSASTFIPGLLSTNFHYSKKRVLIFSLVRMPFCCRDADVVFGHGALTERRLLQAKKRRFTLLVVLIHFTQICVCPLFRPNYDRNPMNFLKPLSIFHGVNLLLLFANTPKNCIGNTLTLFLTLKSL